MASNDDRNVAGDLAQLEQALPVVTDWIQRLLGSCARKARPVGELGLPALERWFRPELLATAKVVCVARVPAPPLKELGLARLEFPVGDGLQGITFGDTYFVRRAAANDPDLHFHELVHVIQWRHLGFRRFLRAYARELLEHGYDGNRFEQMAYRLQRRMQAGAAAFDVEAHVLAALAAQRDVPATS